MKYPLTFLAVMFCVAVVSLILGWEVNKRNHPVKTNLTPNSVIIEPSGAAHNLQWTKGQKVYLDGLVKRIEKLEKLQRNED